MEIETSFTDIDLNTNPEKIQVVMGEGERFHCELSDKAMVHKIARALLEGLSSACVDMTTGDIFKSPGTVAADVRKEMLDYLRERSEFFVAESVLNENPEEERSDHPLDIISDLIDDFGNFKRNLLSRVSGWLLSETREDKIDDFVQEMELNSFWLLDRRETIAQTLLKNVDFKNEFHCNMKFESEEELGQHRLLCGFRTIMCENEGCSSTFSAAHLEEHDSLCPFKMLPCEQKCPDILLRREMDRHCITDCPMRLINCPFYSIGCPAAVPNSDMTNHCVDDVNSHVLYALQYLHKETSLEDLRPRVEQILTVSNGRLAGMQGVRSFTNRVKDFDSMLGALKVEREDPKKAEDVMITVPDDHQVNTEDSDDLQHAVEIITSESNEHLMDIKKSDSVEIAIEAKNFEPNELLNIQKPEPVENSTDAGKSESDEHLTDTKKSASDGKPLVVPTSESEHLTGTKTSESDDDAVYTGDSGSDEHPKSASDGKPVVVPTSESEHLTGTKTSESDDDAV